MDQGSNNRPQQKDLTDLIRQTTDFLRKYGVLEGHPIFERTENELVCVDNKGLCDELEGVFPYWQPQEVDVHQKDFEGIDSVLERTSYEEVQERALREIPNSEDSAIIEVGSGTGVNGAGYLAKHKPNSLVALISKPENDACLPPYLFNKNRPGKHRQVFDAGQEVIGFPQNEIIINLLYSLNGMTNVAFFEYKLELDYREFSKPIKLPDEIQEAIQGRNVYLFGHKIPGELGIIAGRLYNELGAKQMTISLTALERCHPYSYLWQCVQKNLGLSMEELRGLIFSTFDPSKNYLKTPKYDYQHKGEKEVGIMIKLGIALAVAKEVNGEALRNTALGYPNFWNQIDHYVRAER